MEDYLMEEVWKPIPNCNGYFASSLGRIKRADGKIMKQWGTPYLVINLVQGDIQRKFLVHRLVCATFHENPDNKSDVNHINGNKFDNRAVNLEWVSHKENMRHAWHNGLITGDMISKAQKGRHLSEEHKQHISEGNRGKRLSEETKRRISEAKKGNPSTTGFIWVHNEMQKAYIHPEELQNYLDKGYIRGMK